MEIFIGRFHPLLVHLPIGFILLAFLFESIAFFKKTPQGNRKHIVFAYFTALLASVFAVTSGLLLGENEIFNPSSLETHKLMGIGVMLFTLFVLFSKWKSSLVSDKASYTGSVLLVLLASITGHFGGVLTHGDGYLSEYAPMWIQNISAETNYDFTENLSAKHTDSILVYPDLIQPILNNKCAGCHNKKDHLGGLNLSAFQSLFEEGETGTPIVASNLSSSELFKRVSLPPTNSHFMPPEGQALSYSELNIIKYWIEQGADSLMRLEYSSMDEELVTLLLRDYNLDYSPRPYYEKVVADSLDADIFEAFSQYGFQAHYLAEHNFFLDVKYLKDTLGPVSAKYLDSVQDNITILNITDCFITDESTLPLGNLAHLTRLDLHNTNASDDLFQGTDHLKHLEVINVFHTQITNDGLDSILRTPDLKRLYIWQTNITNDHLQEAIREHPEIIIDTGFVFQEVKLPDSLKPEVEIKR